ncbi:MAG: GAF domain-containing protein, partial [Candidatus Latescibacterota bacterium]
MMTPDLPTGEEVRLASLYALKILDTDPEDRFERVVNLASRLFDVPIALVSLVDVDRQWFKACYGLDARSTSRDVSFCGHAIHQSEIFVVEDATRDERFADNPLVTGELGIRFYAGRPLAAPDGSLVGTLCLIDRVARSFGAEDQKALDDLAEMVETELAQVGMAELQRDLAQALSQREAAEKELAENQRELLASRLLRDAALERRLRARIISAKNHAELQKVIEEDLLREMRHSGLPVCSISVQLPSSRAGYFIDAQNLVKNLLVERYITPISAYPWVGEAWEEQKLVVVEKERLHGCKLDPATLCVLEVPLPGEGSMGFSSKVVDAFSTEALHQIQNWANLFDFSGYRRVIKEEYRQRVELVEERVHRTVLEMTEVDDFTQVVGAIGRELNELWVDFEGIGVNLIDEAEGKLTSYSFVDNQIVCSQNTLQNAVNQTLVDYWRRGGAWERVVDAEAGETATWNLSDAYAPSLVIDVPFVYGTLAVGLRAEPGCSTSLIALMRELCDQLSLGYRRLLDIRERI